MSLPPPLDPSFSIDPTEDEYLRPQGGEDEDLLATGAWGPDEETPPASTRRRVTVHMHPKR